MPSDVDLLIVAHVDYADDAHALQAHRRREGLSVSLCTVVAGDAPHALVDKHRPTYLCLIGGVDQVAWDDAPTHRRGGAPPYVGRIGAGTSATPCDRRRASVRRHVRKLIARDEGACRPVRCVGIAADETHCADLPLLTGWRVMAHALSLLDAVPNVQVLVSDGHTTWHRRDSTATPIVPSPLASADCVFLIGRVEGGHIVVPTTSTTSASVLGADTPWDDGCHPVIVALVYGDCGEVEALVDGALTRVDGPCAWCLFHIPRADDPIQAVYTMWGIWRSLYERPDARLGELVHRAIAHTDARMDVDCLGWTICGDPSMRLVRPTRR